MTSSLLRAPFRSSQCDFDTTSPTQLSAIAVPSRPGTVGHVSTSPATRNTVTVVADDDIILDIEDIAARYGIGRTKAYDLVREPGFPASVVPGMTRIPLQALRAYETARSLAGTIAAEPRTAATRPVAPTVVLAPPPAKRPGRPSRKAAA